MATDRIPTPDERLDAVSQTLVDATVAVGGLLRLADANPVDAPELHRVQTTADLAGKLGRAVDELEARARTSGGTLPTRDPGQ